MENKELEQRLINTEQALALALKRIEELSNSKIGTVGKKPLKEFVREEVYNDLFSYSADGKVSGKQSHENFVGIYRRIQIVVGQRYIKNGQHNFSATPLQNLKCSEYDRFGELVGKVCELIWNFKHDKEDTP
ncbi:MAG: hypothetical protein J5994_08820 [Ruminococcus sp.]|nr:hypothetical protein [Ruminococcus sp.]